MEISDSQLFIALFTALFTNILAVRLTHVHTQAQ